MQPVIAYSVLESFRSRTHHHRELLGLSFYARSRALCQCWLRRLTCRIGK